MKTNSLFKTITLSTVIIWISLFVLIPILLLAFSSFLKHSDTHLILFQFTNKNYSQLLNPLYLRIFCQSLTLASSCTLLCLLIGYPAAYHIARSTSPFKSILLLLMIIPFWTSSLIRTYAMLAILKTKGLLNSLLLSIGIIHHPLQLLYSNTAVLIGCVYNLLPFMILPLYANIEKLDQGLLDAARDLGANRYRILTRITLPLTLPGIMAGCLLVFLPAMTLFYIPEILGGAKNMLLGNLIENQFLSMRNWPGGAATSITLSLLMLVLIYICRRLTQGKSTKALI